MIRCGELSLLYCFTTLIAGRVSCEMLDTELINRLLDPSIYSKRERPGRQQGVPTTVKLSIYVTSIGGVSEVDMDFTVTMFLRQMWRDHRLTYNNYTGLGFDTMTLSYEYASQIWQPDIYIKNERSHGQKHEISVPNIMLTLASDGSIFYSQRISTTLGCMMRLQRYPLDQQTCHIALESYSYSSRDIIVEWNNGSESLSIASDLELPEFHLTSNDVSDCTQTYTTGNQTASWSCVSASLVLRRMFEYYMIQVYVPSIMIVILSWVSFWIDIHAVPARVSLGLLTVLTMTTQSSGISGKLPRVSYIKAIDVWMFTCMTFVFGALIEYSVVNVLTRKADTEKYSVERNECTDDVTDDVTAKIPSKAEQEESQSNGNIQYVHEENINERRQCVKQNTCNIAAWWKRQRKNKAVLTDIISRFLFPFSFIVFNIIYWGYYYFFPKYKGDF